MKSYQNVLLFFDLLSVSPHLMIDSNYLNKTNLGGMFTLLLGLLAVCFFFIFLGKLINRTSPNVLYSNEFEKYTNMSLSNKNYGIWFALLDPNGFAIQNEKELFSMEFVKTCVNFTTDPKTKAVTKTQHYKYGILDKCTSAHFGDQWDLFQNSRWVDGYCIPSEILNDYYVINPVRNGAYDYCFLNVNVFKCKNETQGNSLSSVSQEKCSSDEEINRSLSSYMIKTGSLDYIINSENFEYPVQKSLIINTLPSSIDNFKSLYYNYKKIEYTRDDALLFTANDTSLYYSLSHFEYYSDSFPPLDLPGAFIQFRIAINDRGIHDRYRRSYTKITNILADVGGFINFLHIIFGFIQRQYSILDLYNKLLKCYSIDYSPNLEMERLVNNNRRMNVVLQAEQPSSAQLVDPPRVFTTVYNITNSMINKSVKPPRSIRLSKSLCNIFCFSLKILNNKSVITSLLFKLFEEIDIKQIIKHSHNIQLLNKISLKDYDQQMLSSGLLWNTFSFNQNNEVTQRLRNRRSEKHMLTYVNH